MRLGNRTVPSQCSHHIRLIPSRIAKTPRHGGLTHPSTHSSYQQHRSMGRHRNEAWLAELISLCRSKFKVVQINHPFHLFVYHSVFHLSCLCTLQMIVHSRPSNIILLLAFSSAILLCRFFISLIQMHSVYAYRQNASIFLNYFSS